MKYQFKRTLSLLVYGIVISFASTFTSSFVWAAGAVVLSIDSPQISEYVLFEHLEEIRRDVHSDVGRLKELGYLDLSAEAAARFSIDVLSAQFLPQDTILGRLSFPYVEYDVHVEGLEMRGLFAALGHESEVNQDISSDLAVVYFHPLKKMLVTVRRLDQFAFPSKTVLFEEFANFPLGKYRGSLIARKANDGKSISTLTWFTDRFRFEVLAGGYGKIDEFELVAKQVGLSVAKGY